MDENELIELKRDYNTRIEKIEKRHRKFITRISVIANLIIPGLGFFIYGLGYFNGLISFILFYGYIIFHRMVIYPITDLGGMVFYLFPALIVWIVSSVMVSNLDY